MSKEGRPVRLGRRVVHALALLALAVLPLAGLLALLELGMRIAGYQAIYEVYSKPSVLWTRDELLGWSHEPGAEASYVGPRPYPIEYEIPIRINSLGLRGPLPGELPPEGYRVLLLGDSVVAGFEVPYEETFAAVAEAGLAQRLDFPVQVVNAGVRGYGTDQSLLYYRERGRALRPDLVVFVYSNNDHENNITLHRMRRPFGKAALVPREDGSLELVGHPIPDYPICSARSLDASLRPHYTDRWLTRGVCRLQILLFDRSALFSALSQRIRRSRRLMEWLYDLGGSRGAHATSRSWLGEVASLAGAKAAHAAEERSVRYDYALTTDLILELRRLVLGDGAHFVMLIGEQEVHLLDEEKLRASEIELLHPPSLGPLDDPRALRFRNDAHYNAAGHRFVARALIERIEVHARRPRESGNRSPGEASGGG